MNETLPHDPNAILLALLQGHGVAAQQVGQEIHFPDSVRRASAVVVQQRRQPGGAIVQLDVSLWLGPGQRLVESFGGIGASEDEALADAFQGFMSTSLHVLLVAFLGGDPATVPQTHWGPWQVTRGEFGLRGNLPPGGEAHLAHILKALAALLEAQPLPEGTHWLRLYYAQLQGQRRQCELLLDNEPWPEGQATLERLAWPVGEAFYSVRLFLVLQRGEALAWLLPLFYEAPEADDAQLFARLCATGLVPHTAERLVALVPLAFGRVLLAGLPIALSPRALVQGDTPREIALAEEPLYAQAHWLAERAYRQGTLTQPEFAALALRSAEVHVVNQALREGAQPEDLILGPPIFFWEG